MIMLIGEIVMSFAEMGTSIIKNAIQDNLVNLQWILPFVIKHVSFRTCLITI